MKKTISLVLTLLFFGNFYAQSYSFSKTTETYTNLVNSTPLNFGDFTLDFPFYYFGVQQTVVNIDGSAFVFDPMSTSPSLFIPIMVGGDWGTGTGSFRPSKLTVGQVGNRITKIEYKNAKLADNLATGTPSTKVVNFQVWLYENSNVIEFRYGSSNATAQDYTDSYDSDNYVYVANGLNDQNSMSLYGDPSNPSVDYYNFTEWQNDIYQPLELTGVIGNSTCYTFTPNLLEINDLDMSLNVSISPNPANDFISVELVDAQIEAIKVLDLNGKILSNSTKKGAGAEINISTLSAGVYLLKITTEKGTAVKRFVKE